MPISGYLISIHLYHTSAGSLFGGVRLSIPCPRLSLPRLPKYSEEVWGFLPPLEKGD
jgi:hypothetical protein